MGVDWTRMRIKADVNLAAIRELIELQSCCFPNRMLDERLAQIAFNKLDSISLAEKDKIYTESSYSLRQLLEFENYPPSDFPDLDLSRRVYIITYNSIFPLELRRDAYRTFLPETVPKQLEIWKNYYLAVKQGKFQDYMLNLYLYEHTYNFYRSYKLLKEYAELSLKKSNLWANKPDFLDIRERILNFAEPYKHPAPVWLKNEPQINYNYLEVKYIYELVCKYTDEYRQLNLAWNSRVPRNWKTSLLKKCHFEEFIDTSDDLSSIHTNSNTDADLCNFFNWVERCYSKNMGLFLDYKLLLR